LQIKRPPTIFLAAPSTAELALAHFSHLLSKCTS
jgi:hypothetical protein